MVDPLAIRGNELNLHPWLLAKKFERTESSGVVYYYGIDLDPDKVFFGDDKSGDGQ